jgi:hypothetical protein
MLFSIDHPPEQGGRLVAVQPSMRANDPAHSLGRIRADMAGVVAIKAVNLATPCFDDRAPTVFRLDQAIWSDFLDDPGVHILGSFSFSVVLVDVGTSGDEAIGASASGWIF